MHPFLPSTYSDFWRNWRGVTNFSLLHAQQLLVIFWCSARFVFSTSTLCPLPPPGKKMRCYSRWRAGYATAYEFGSGFMLLSPAWMHEDDDSRRKELWLPAKFCHGWGPTLTNVQTAGLWRALLSYHVAALVAAACRLGRFLHVHAMCATGLAAGQSYCRCCHFGLLDCKPSCILWTSCSLDEMRRMTCMMNVGEACMLHRVLSCMCTTMHATGTATW